MLARETRVDDGLPEGMSATGTVSKSTIPVCLNSASRSHAWESLYIPTLCWPMELAEMVDGRIIVVTPAHRTICLLDPLAPWRKAWSSTSSHLLLISSAAVAYIFRILQFYSKAYWVELKAFKLGYLQYWK
jgi:hypothetical protein